MVPFPIPDLMDFATGLDSLSRIKQGTLSENYGSIFIGKYYLEAFLSKSVFKSRLRSSLPLANLLLGILTEYEKPDQLDRTLSEYDLQRIKSAFNDFRVTMNAELGSLTAYLATPKAGFDINVLLETPDRLFPESLGIKVPEALVDIREASRC